MTLGDRLKSYLEANGISQKDLAEQIGVASASMSQFCSGARNPSPRTVRDICEALSINEAWLLTGEGPQKQVTPDTIVDELVKRYNLSGDAVRILSIIARAFQRLSAEQAHEMVEIAKRELLGGESLEAPQTVREAVEQEEGPAEAGPVDQGRKSS